MQTLPRGTLRSKRSPASTELRLRRRPLGWLPQTRQQEPQTKALLLPWHLRDEQRPP